jgi:arsenate reductase
MPLTLYHNPRCSKSRRALALLRERGIRPEIVQYLQSPPAPARLRELLGLLDLRPRDLMRKGETSYAALGLDDPGLSDAELIQALHEHPELIERPIAVHGLRARLGRPPEAVLELLDDEPPA